MNMWPAWMCVTESQPPLHPLYAYSYLAFTGVATLAAALTGSLVPWEVGFLPAQELYRQDGPWAVIDLCLTTLFGAGMLVSFRLVRTVLRPSVCRLQAS
jgi:hypothetical protein